MNSVVLVGRVGKDAEYKPINDKGGFISFSLATDDSYFKDREKVEVTNWHNINLWGSEKLANAITKGTQLVVPGQIQYETYEKDGEKRYITKIKSMRIEFIGGGKQDNGSKKTEPKKTYQQVADQMDEPPF